MEPLQFLGGKYQEPEQIVPGEVQTFRAREASTGQTVFVHRMSTAMGDAQQAALLRLVLQGLFRSPSARSHVLDFGRSPATVTSSRKVRPNACCFASGCNSNSNRRPPGVTVKVQNRLAVLNRSRRPTALQL